MWLFLKRTRHSLLPGNKFGKYLIYAFGEIVLVVLGILIALQIDNWNEGRLEAREAKRSYENVRRQILQDKMELGRARDLNSNLMSAYERALKIIVYKDSSKMDSLALITMALSQYSDFHRSGNIYETLVNSGDMGLLKNHSVINALQHLENTYIRINKLEEMHWELIMRELSPEIRGVINYLTFEVERPDKLYSIELQNIYYEIIGLCKMKEAVYAATLVEIDALIENIYYELNDGNRE